MNARALAVDLGVWLSLVVLLAGVVGATVQLTKPPSRAEQEETAHTRLVEQCMRSSEMNGVLDNLKPRVCGCMALNAEWSNWGTLDRRDFPVCKQNVARLIGQPVEAAAQIAETGSGPWETFDTGYAAIRETAGLNWMGGLVCSDPPAYLTIGGATALKVMRRYPDASGAYRASGVPVTVTGDGAKLFEDQIICDAGANEGDSDSCYVTLTADRLDQMFASSSVTVSLGGKSLDAVPFAEAIPLRNIRDACYRSAAP